MPDSSGVQNGRIRFHIFSRGRDSWHAEPVEGFTSWLEAEGFTPLGADEQGWPIWQQGDALIMVSTAGWVSCKGKRARDARAKLEELTRQVREQYLREKEDSARLPFRLLRNSASGWRLVSLPGQDSKEAFDCFVAWLKKQGFAEVGPEAKKDAMTWQALTRDDGQQVITISFTWMVYGRGRGQKELATWLDELVACSAAELAAD